MTTAYRLTGWRRLQDDLETLGLRPRRVHDVRRTTNSLLILDGATDPILTFLLWGPPKKVKDLYTTLPWAAFCNEMIKLRTPEQVPDEAADSVAALAKSEVSEPENAV